MENNWQIVDDNGIIHSGTSEEMSSAWDVMACNSLEEYFKMMAEMDIELICADNIDSLYNTYEKYPCEFTGDLKLIEVHEIHK